MVEGAGAGRPEAAGSFHRWAAGSGGLGATLLLLAVRRGGAAPDAQRRREARLPAYVVLHRFTDQGRRNMKRTVERAARLRRESEARGFTHLGQFWRQYWTQGKYDLVTVIDAPSDEALMAWLFEVSEAGNVTTESMRAFTDGEMGAILGGSDAPTAP